MLHCWATAQCSKQSLLERYVLCCLLFSDRVLWRKVNKLLGSPIKELSTVINMLACEPVSDIPALLDCLKVSSCGCGSNSGGQAASQQPRPGSEVLQTASYEKITDKFFFKVGDQLAWERQSTSCMVHCTVSVFKLVEILTGC